jgi:photosystem II stability/assembly factor-like uncharacterized protein
MLYLATNNGVFTAEYGEDWQITGSSLLGHQVTSIIAHQDHILVGTREGIFASDDAGKTWRAAESDPDARIIRWLAWRKDSPGSALAGTEPAGIFHSVDGGRTWQACPEVAALRDQLGWSLPYSPEAGCVRGFALHGTRAYAAVEVGGVLVSADSGQTWRLAEGSDGRPNFQRPPEPFIHPDVHSIYVHPSSTERVYAPTGGGFYRSDDGGATWRFLYDCYCRAAWVDPLDAGHIILGPANGVDRGGRIEETYDGGVTWHNASHGMTVPWARFMVERFQPVMSELLAVLSDGSLLASSIVNLSWRRILAEVAGINAVAHSG